MKRYINNGKFTELSLDILAILGVLIMVLAYIFVDLKELKILLMILGLVVGSISTIAAKAQLFGLKPFDNSYKKAKQSYQSHSKEELES